MKLKCPKDMTGSRRGVLNETGIENLPSLLASIFSFVGACQRWPEGIAIFSQVGAIVLEAHLSLKLCSA